MPATPAQGADSRAKTASADRTRPALELIHRLLETPPPAAPLDWQAPLGDLASAFGACGAGLAALVDGQPALVRRVRGRELVEPTGPWQVQPEVLARETGAPVTVGMPGGGTCLVVKVRPDGGEWIFWLEEDKPRAWSAGEAAALWLAGQALGRLAWTGRAGRPARVQRVRLQGRLEEAAAVMNWLAHDFGNFLTGILGFTELALGHMRPGPPEHGFVAEARKAAERGADFVRRLLLFSRRGPTRFGPTSVAATAMRERDRLAPTWGPTVEFRATIPADLPRVMVDEDSLRQVLVALLDNARAAVGKAGTIAVGARAVQLTGDDCLELLGAPRPGPAVELTVADNGVGLGADDWRRLATEPFFSIRPRHHGMGLAVVYGILRSYQGGYRLEPGPERGVVARVFLPAEPARG